MVLAVDVTDRHGSSDEMHRQLQPKKTKVGLLLPFIYLQKTFYPPFITNKTEHVSFKGECLVGVAKHLKGDWFMVWH